VELVGPRSNDPKARRGKRKLSDNRYAPLRGACDESAHRGNISGGSAVRREGVVTLLCPWRRRAQVPSARPSGFEPLTFGFGETFGA
jgi:hypothetical protein